MAKPGTMLKLPSPDSNSHSIQPLTINIAKTSLPESFKSYILCSGDRAKGLVISKEAKSTSKALIQDTPNSVSFKLKSCINDNSRHPSVSCPSPNNDISFTPLTKTKFLQQPKKQYGASKVKMPSGKQYSV